MTHSVGSEGRGEKDPDAQDRAHSAGRGDRSSRLFDLRFLIGGLFTLYGLMVSAQGLLDSASDLRKSGGMRINLWTGLGMLGLGLLFLLWAFVRPVQPGGHSSDHDAAAGGRGDGGVPKH